jgi:hypothetical protein
MNILYIESFSPQKTHSRMLIFGIIHLLARLPFCLLKPASEHVHARLLPKLSWSWTVLLLVIHIENLLCLLQLFYFHLWPIYWLSLIITSKLD